MKVTAFQTDPVLLDVEANLEDVIEKVRRARENGADLIVFPELALTGYFVGQRYHEAALRLDSKEIQRLVEASKGTAVIVGFIEESLSMNFYNSALVVVDGEIQYACRKLNLPNYGVFEERKVYSHGKTVRVFRLHDFTIAVFICNDMWHPSLPYLGVTQKADIFVTIINSSDSSMGSEFSNIESWRIINTFYARVFGIYNICVNRVGEEKFHPGRPGSDSRANRIPVEDQPAETNYCFWGGSEIINPFGTSMAEAALYKPDEISADIQRELLRQKRILLPYLRNDDPYFTHRELQRILYEKTPTTKADNPNE
jgi:predicted amidohydrolase